MFNKTTSLAYQHYGSIVDNLPKAHLTKGQIKSMKIQTKDIERLYSYDRDVYVKVEKGIVLLLVSDVPDTDFIERFVIHRTTKIRKNVYFNFIALSNDARISMYRPFGIKKLVSQLENSFTYTRIQPSFQVKEIFAYYYTSRNTNYCFDGEKHNYWELTYVDNGCLLTTIDNQSFELNSFDLILYAPRQFHSQKTTATAPCNSLTIMFDMNLPHPELLMNRVFNCQKNLSSTLNNFIRTTNSDFKSYSHDLLLCYLNELIIQLLQYDEDLEIDAKSVQIQRHFDSELLNEIIIYINSNIYKPLEIDEICHQFSISRSSLQTLFKENIQVPPKQYINELKLSKSKILIKEGKYTISEIAMMLGFGSIHYFSRKFKQRYNISPTEYAKSIYD